MSSRQTPNQRGNSSKKSFTKTRDNQSNDRSSARSNGTRHVSFNQQQRWLSAAWNQWRLQTYRQPLDKFIRNKASEWRRQFGSALPLTLSQKLFDAARFTPLICALEMTFQRQQPLTAESWKVFNDTDTALDISDGAFWFWLAQRQGQAWSAEKGWEAGNRPQVWDTLLNDLPDQQQRQQLCQTLLDSDSLPPFEQLQPWFWLWYGWPSDWINEVQLRARTSGWQAAELQQFIEYQSERPPTYLRLPQDADSQAYIDELKQQGVRVVKTQTGSFDYTQALAIDGGQSIHQTDLFRKGALEIQDLASQLATAEVPLKARQHVWDCCAGAGGKTLALAQRLGNRGSVTATDCYANKLQELKKRAKRAGIMNVRSFEWKGDQPLKLPKAIGQRGGFDCVVADVPCSGSGTWRRNPDILWHKDHAEHGHLADLKQLQNRLLTHASAGVKEGGYLVYMTCSWRVEENEQQIEQFIADNPGFVLRDQKLLGQPQLNSDCLFVARLERTAD